MCKICEKILFNNQLSKDQHINGKRRKRLLAKRLKFKLITYQIVEKNIKEKLERIREDMHYYKMYEKFKKDKEMLGGVYLTKIQDDNNNTNK